MEIVNNTYKQLNEIHKLTKYAYSTDYLKQGKGYLAHLQSIKKEASVEALYALYGSIMRQRVSWKESGKHKNGSEKVIYKQYAEHFRNIERNIEEELKNKALTMWSK